jgi:hypothetical protein
VFERRGVPVSEEHLRQLEVAVGAELPADYRSFLIEGDGAKFRQYNEIEGTFHGALREVFAVGDPDGSARSLDHIRRLYDERVPAEFLPIADDLGGNLYCLGVRGEHRGSVFFWDHEMEAEEGEPPTMENMEQVAASFEELVSRVRVE